MPIYMQEQVPQSKYADLLAVIEELGKDIKPTYAGSRSASDRLKRGVCIAYLLSIHHKTNSTCLVNFYRFPDNSVCDLP